MSFFPDETKNYSSKVNPFIDEFISFNSLTNINQVIRQSEIKPFNNNLSQFKKAGPVYSMHRYWTKQPIEIIEKYIQHFCPSNGIVLDPFCGSGTTGTAALYSNRKVILSDLSPIASFITKNYTETTDINSMDKALESLSNKFKPVINKFYNSRCPDCHNEVRIRDWIYAENYSCPSCSQTIPFIPSENKSDFLKIMSQKHSRYVVCPSCNKQFFRGNLKTIDPSVLGLRYSCKTCKVYKKFKLLDTNDYQIFSDKCIFSVSDSFLKIPLPIGVSTNQAINKGIVYVNQFFTPLTFYILFTLWSYINEFPDFIKSKFQFIFSSILYRVTKLYRLRVKGQGGVLSGTLYIPPLFQDINVWDVFLERFRKISRGWHELNTKLPENFNDIRLVSTNSATDLPLPSNSIDYVYTDPPYGGNINYSELNFIWEAWFNLTTNKENEVIINEVGQNKGLTEYEQLFTLSLNEIYRVLKPNSWCSLVFNSSSSKIWSSIQKIIANSDFLLSQDITSVHSKMTTAKQTQSLKTARNYMILNLFKEGPSTRHNAIKFSSLKLIDKTSLEQLLVSKITDLITNASDHVLGYNDIYDYVISIIVSTYSFNEFNLEALLKNHFKQVQKDYWSI